ncbi:MAG: hypothetical protein PeribacterA2_1147 [Candidatus Peribacter riflensis]|uniref:Uncharacterized protein n=1 Tax=Candidatus Peribacter riflensis TaxID=1735162 RepID=A0A0S1SL93_9BACT|nr:MAG: hypothetical protein PeribacterA2_1147 [Candidatus Peribacter riflensis]ALM11602.1 MAG: hypothetical protein PeribacterB2_1149 [Candidatus Peribacter riflensis]ALM12704.1 MAG: hypothetical protein PeribacterC2_1148 [Candidatus Peribacter riflensis]ALM13805.1 MAG: hypothetical protein PeribacterD1_1147 [Candidatus Peribacter riflensis]ALM14908.1 MAG: hypothetical protein PeribacterD2_1149 [Candidatus Peribacter riflensis]
MWGGFVCQTGALRVSFQRFLIKQHRLIWFFKHQQHPPVQFLCGRRCFIQLPWHFFEQRSPFQLFGSQQQCDK